MDGVILHFDSATDAGFIRASDGKRYRFNRANWSASEAIRQGDSVDFEPLGEIASEIFVTNPPANSKIFLEPSIQRNNEVRQILNERESGTKELLNIIKERPALISGVLILLASLLPFVTFPPMPILGFEGGSYNLFSSVMKFSAGLGILGTVAPASVTVPLRLIYLEFAIPAAAMYLIYRELIGTSDDVLRFRTGLFAVLGPVGIPIASLIVAIVLNGGVNFLENMVNRAGSGMSAISSLFGLGLILIMASGITLIATAKGLNPIRALLGSFVYLLLLASSTDFPVPVVLFVGMAGGVVLLAAIQGVSIARMLEIEAEQALQRSSAQSAQGDPASVSQNKQAK